VIFGGEQEPALADLEQLHHQAHEECFIANSVNTVVTTEIVI
jgi:organic hydroperoxide reductase OsmC/OhrA